MNKFYLSRPEILLFLLMFFAIPSHGQFLRTSYFMEGAPHRLQLNPALTPGRGYINIPVIGSFYVRTTSNTLGSQDLIDILDDEGSFFNNPKFRNRLKDENRLSYSFNTDVISFGFFKGRNFWSFNTGMRIDAGAVIPRSMFDYLHTVDQPEFDWNQASFNIGNEEFSMNVYNEIGIGFARSVDERLTIGAKLKALLGAGNLRLDVERVNINTNLPEYWNDMNLENIDNYYSRIHITAEMESSFVGLEMIESHDGYVEDFEFKSYGIAGLGGAFDLGASYRLNDRLELSAAVIDVGFIAWSEKNTRKATARGTVSYEGKDYEKTEEGMQKFRHDVDSFTDRLNSGEILNHDMLQLVLEDGTARTTSLYPTVALGGNLALAGNLLTVGALSTTRFMQPRTETELTVSGNVCPANWFNAAVSYSVTHSTIGAAIKLGPLFVGADHLPLSNNPQSADFFLGLSIPLGKKKSEYWF